MKKLLITSSWLAMVTGLILIVAGLWGICFTYKNVSRENIITPDDASVPAVHVRGPLSLKAQADIIREHTLRMTDGKTYSEMPRQIETVDTSGKTVLVPNDARDTWITATTLTTALNLAIVTYVFSGLVVLLGFISIWTGIVFRALIKRV